MAALSGMSISVDLMMRHEGEARQFDSIYTKLCSGMGVTVAIEH